jgi:hypothetical protein
VIAELIAPSENVRVCVYSNEIDVAVSHDRLNYSAVLTARDDPIILKN